MLQPLVHGLVAPCEVRALGLLDRALEPVGEGEQAFGGVRAAVEHHILAGLAQLRVDLLIDLQLTRVDDAHVHARLNGVEQEDGVHRLAHMVVAAEREGEVRHAA